LALALLTGGDRSIGIVRLRTKTTEFIYCGDYYIFFAIYKGTPYLEITHVRDLATWAKLLDNFSYNSIWETFIISY
jgi:hypothetical protein